MAGVKARRRLLLALCLLLCNAASSARAAVKEFSVTGEVLSASKVLAPYGVQKGSAVNVTWSVELTTPPFSVSGSPDNKTDYCGPISFIVIQIGTWSAVKVAPVVPCQNSIAVADDSGGVLDLLHIVTPGSDNDLVLHTNLPGGFLNLSLDFYGLGGAASTNQGLDQNPLLYDGGVGSALGPGGGVYFTIDTSGSGGGGGPVDPTASCRKAQLKAGAKLCKSELACHAKYAKNPFADPLRAKRDLCLAKAADKFTSAYDAAALKAEDKSLVCGTSAPASEPIDAITGQVDAVVAEVDAIEPGYAPLESAWLSAAGAACFASVGAQSADAGKPNPGLAAALEKAALKLDTAAQKAAAKAADKGVVFVPPLDIPAFHDAVNDAIEAATSEINGD